MKISLNDGALVPGQFKLEGGKTNFLILAPYGKNFPLQYYCDAYGRDKGIGGYFLCRQAMTGYQV